LVLLVERTVDVVFGVIVLLYLFIFGVNYFLE